MKRIAVILGFALLASAPGAARADGLNAGQTVALHSRAQTTTADAKVFILKGHRILVPADQNSDAMIAALKRRFPDLKPDSDPRGDRQTAN